MDIKKNITIHCDNRRLVRKLKNVIFTPWRLLLRKRFPLLPLGFEPVTSDAVVALVAYKSELVTVYYRKLPSYKPFPPPPPPPNCRPFEAKPVYAKRIFISTAVMGLSPSVDTSS